MNVRLQNLVGKPIWFQLNSGRTIDLSPTRPPVEVPRSEYDSNPRIRTLEARGAIRVLDLPEKKPQIGIKASVPASSGKAATKRASAEEKKQT